jgi:hypothetical protein
MAKCCYQKALANSKSVCSWTTFSTIINPKSGKKNPREILGLHFDKPKMRLKEKHIINLH